jgi:hypothetical protein
MPGSELPSSSKARIAGKKTPRIGAKTEIEMGCTTGGKAKCSTMKDEVNNSCAKRKKRTCRPKQSPNDFILLILSK